MYPRARRPSRKSAEKVIADFLDAELGTARPEFQMVPDGHSGAASPEKVGWAFWIMSEDTTSYVNNDLTIQWYGTEWEPGMDDDPRCCSRCGHKGSDGDAHATHSYCTACMQSVPSPEEDRCPNCGQEGHMCLACPECEGHYVLDDDPANPVWPTDDEGNEP